MTKAPQAGAAHTERQREVLALVRHFVEERRQSIHVAWTDGRISDEQREARLNMVAADAAALMGEAGLEYSLSDFLRDAEARQIGEPTNPFAAPETLPEDVRGSLVPSGLRRVVAIASALIALDLTGMYYWPVLGATSLVLRVALFVGGLVGMLCGVVYLAVSSSSARRRFGRRLVIEGAIYITVSVVSVGIWILLELLGVV